VAIECPTDAAWRGLVDAMGRPDWAVDRRLRTAVGRVRAGEALDARIGAWTVRHTAGEVERRLQAAGVPAGRVSTTAEATRDAGLEAAGFWRDVSHERAGVFRLRGVPWTVHGAAPPGRGRAPDLGEHNGWVLGELLGCEAGTLAELEADGVIGRVPVGSGS
jgi:crotonobetainyl-CoA:carnitine CoA-transferase CaiB-like acyl-CoA transferase